MINIMLNVVSILGLVTQASLCLFWGLNPGPLT